MRVVLASHAFQGPVLRVGSHHYARELSLRGAEVLHLSTAWAGVQGVGGRGGARADAARGGPRADEHGTVHAVPMSVVPMRLGGGNAAALRVARSRGFDRPDLLLVDQPLFAPFAGRLGARVLVYRPTDAHPGRLMSRREHQLVRRADGVVATSGPVLDSLGPVPAGTPTAVIENGVDFARFARPRAAAREGVVYVGAVDARFDWSLVAAVARALPDVPVQVIGPVTQAPPAGLPGSVHVLGPVDYDDVPDHLARARVGLIPMSLDPQNAGRSPMKYYEYLAAGLQVVARRTPALAARGEPGTWLYDGTQDGVDAVRQALDAPGENAAGREGARRHDWSAKASELLDFVGTVRHVAAR